MNRQKQLIYYAILLAAGGARFYNLGYLDLQAWDEALYAVRAESILKYGVWLDQARYAIDGLYSTLHPPLYVWLTAISFSIFGVTELAARIPSALFGLLTIPMIYHIGKRLSNEQAGLFAALFFALNPFVTFFARQGQFDSALVFFLSLSALCLLKWIDERMDRHAFLAGLATGAALMTKLYVGLGIPLTFALWIGFFQGKERRSGWAPFFILVAGAALIALPWHILMTIRHGGGDLFFFLTSSSLVERSLQGIEGNVKPLEVLYFMNQLIVLFPLGIAWFLLGSYRLVRSRESRGMLVFLWFCVFFAVFSLIRTKLAVYVLPMLVPASLIAGSELWRSISGSITFKENAILIGGTSFSLIWSFSQEWRNGIKSVIMSVANLHLPSTDQLVTILPFVILLILSILLSRSIWSGGLTRSLLRRLHYVLFLPAAAWISYQIVVSDSTRWKDGASELAKLIEGQGYERIVVAGYERNPQLTYYLHGADIGWRDDIQVRRIRPPQDRTPFRSWMLGEVSGEPDEALIVIEKDKFIRYETIDPLKIIPPDFVQVFDSKRYAAFQRISFVHLAHESTTHSGEIGRSTFQ